MQALSVLSPEKIYIILDRIACLKPIWWCWDVYQLFFIKNRVSNKIYVGFIQGEDSKSHIPWSVLLLFEELIDNIILRSIFSSNNFNKIGSYFVVANCIPFFFFFSLADFSNQAQIMYFKFFFYLFFFYQRSAHWALSCLDMSRTAVLSVSLWDLTRGKVHQEFCHTSLLWGQ